MTSTNLQILGGRFTSNNYAISLTANLTINCGTTCALTLGTSIVTLSSINAVLNVVTTAHLTLSAASSTLLVTNTSSTGKTIGGNSTTWGNLTITGGGTGAITFTGANTFATLTIGHPKSIVFPASTTTTVTAFSAVGAAASLVTITSSSAGTAATLSQASGTVCSDYLSLKDSTATGGATFHAGVNSTFVSNVTGWLNTSCGVTGPCTLALLGAGVC